MGVCNSVVNTRNWSILVAVKKTTILKSRYGERALEGKTSFHDFTN